MNARIQPRRKGLSTIELLSAATVLGITAIIAFPNLQHIGAGQRVELAAYQLASDLQIASNTARANGEAVTIRFEESGSGNRYWISNGRRSQTGENWQVDLSDTLYGVEMTSAPIEINFDANGCPDMSGFWTFSYNGLHEKSVGLDQMSGEVVVQ